jgi:hypothetical protein
MEMSYSIKTTSDTLYHIFIQKSILKKPLFIMLFYLNVLVSPTPSFFMRNDLPEPTRRGRRNFSAEKYSVHFDEKAKKEKHYLFTSQIAI